MSRFYVQALSSRDVFSAVTTEIKALTVAFQETFTDSSLLLGVYEIGQPLPVYLVRDCKAHQVTPMGRAPSVPSSCITDLDTIARGEGGARGGLPASAPSRPLANV